MVSLTITGAKEVEHLLDQLEKKETGKICRKGTRDVQKSAILPDTKANALSVVGGDMGTKIAKYLGVRAMTKLKRGHYGAKTIIKPYDEFIHVTKEGKRYYIPFAIEYGHGFHGRSGNKDVRPMPYMRKAYEENKQKAVSHLSIRIKILLEEAVRRLRK